MFTSRTPTRALRPLLSAPQICKACRIRGLATSPALRAPKTEGPNPEVQREPQLPPAQRFKLPNKETKDDEFVPELLGRPIGFNRPPLPGENSGQDNRSLAQRRRDFVDYDKHLERRKAMTKKAATPYFKDWSNMRFSKGKMFLANPRIFKAEAALFFPNFQGYTLATPSQLQDTTNVLLGKVSVVAVYSSQWALNQVSTFLSKRTNPELSEVLEKSHGKAQRVDVNVEDNMLKRGIVRLFFGRLKRARTPAEWKRWFLVGRAIDDEIKDTIGVLNSKVGYIYLVDKECRIRWAACANATEEEREYLVNGLKKILGYREAGNPGVSEKGSEAERKLQAQSASA